MRFAWLFLLPVAGAVWIPSAQAAEARPFLREDRILIIPRPGQAEAMARLHASQRVTIRRRFPALGNIEVLALPKGADPIALAARYRQSGLVEKAEVDRRIHLTATPNDPAFLDGTQWGLHNLGQNGGAIDADIDAPEGWDTLNTATNIIVAVIDTGARYTHQDLAANLWTNPREIPGNGLDDDLNGIVDDVHGLNSIANNGDPFDDVGHGTHVAGIIGAVGDNGAGVSGVCWRVQLMICKFLDNTGGSVSDLIQCLDYARANGAKVVNCSFVTPEFDAILSAAFGSIRNAGIVVVAAAGNNGTDNDLAPQYPAGYEFDNIIAVTGTTRTDEWFAGFNYGATSVDLAAPGEQIYSTYNGHDADYFFLSGTSMAAPCVAGAAAILLSRFPSADYHEIISRLLVSVDPLPSLVGRCRTGGRLNLSKALGPPLQADFTPSTTAGLFPLTVHFTNTSFGVITNDTWDFGDGSPGSDAQSPTHLFVDAGNYTVTLTVRGTNGNTSVNSRIIRAVGNYQIQPATFDWLPTNGMTALTLSGDGVSGPHTLPFSFRLYGQEYRQLFICASGLIGFVNSGLGTGANADLPESAVPNALLCPLWDDLNPVAGGSIWYGVEGVPPNRKAVVSWIDVPHAVTAGGPTRFTFQSILHESQHITFQYLDVENGRNNLVSGKSATIGIEDTSGVIAAKYSFNGSPSMVTNHQALLFGPYGSIGPFAPSLAQPNLSAQNIAFTLFAAPLQSCVVQASSNLTSWIPIGTNWVPASGVVGFSEPGSIGQRRFYRAVAQE